ncbi:MAG TPA: 30S ribosomal protein S20 [Candidatus Aminicenantes bacterium]|nr:30S ribosomal protein S20 [Candidatus Aminicenantes bacterium]HRY64324.1 30S ribosomal protein S20 [Candidatus Aminicenantes bacterium]HRZ71237.1 30S ribosomal protein S20 [Candidatus Aminicenantes bacterium]
MARHKSAIRQHRRSLRRKSVNTQNKSALRTEMRKVREALAAKDREAAAKLLPAVFKAVDTSVKKGSIKKNTGSRYKSRLSRQVAALAPTAAK